MTSTNPSMPATKDAKLITCYLTENGSDKKLMQALRNEKNIIQAKSISCRGIAVLQSVKSKSNCLPEPTMVRMVEVVVAEDQAEALFDYIYQTAGIGQQGGGAICMGPLAIVSTFELPEIEDEIVR